MIQLNTLEIHDGFLLYKISEVVRKAMYDTISLEVERIYEFECNYVEYYNSISMDTQFNIGFSTQFKSGFEFNFNTGYRFLLSDFKYIIQQNDKQLNLELSLNKKYNYDNLNLRCMIVVEENIPQLYIADDILVSNDEEYKEIIIKINNSLNNYLYGVFRIIFERVQNDVYTLVNRRRE